VLSVWSKPTLKRPPTPLPQGARGDARRPRGSPPLPRQGEGLGVRAAWSPRELNGPATPGRIVQSREIFAPGDRRVNQATVIDAYYTFSS